MPFLSLNVPIVMMSTVLTNSCTVLPEYYRKHIHTTQLKFQMCCTSLLLYSPSYHFNKPFYFSLRNI